VKVQEAQRKGFNSAVISLFFFARNSVVIYIGCLELWNHMTICVCV